jgi:formylglycine-generating enzyme required for sulfatase activity
MNQPKQRECFLVLLLAATVVMLGEPAAQDALTGCLSVQMDPETAGVPQLTLYSYPGASNEVQFAGTLGGTTAWSVLTTVVLTDHCTAVLNDTTMPPNGQRFYRAVLLGAPRPAVSSNYVWIPPGQFHMGSPATEQDRLDFEGPQTLVTLTRGFYMNKYLVTQGEYLALMGTNTSYFIGDTNRPVEACNWYNATNYCGRLTASERQAGRLPAGWTYRLPTEAEWEYACRAGTTTRFFYGDDPGYTNLTDYAWFDANSYTTAKPPGVSYFVLGCYFTTQPVGQKLPNPWGLYDMCGEVDEWCQDWFGLYPGGSVMDPQGPATAGNIVERVYRGGSWLDAPAFLRSAFRESAPPDNVSGLYGFRVVLAPSRD